MGIITDFAKSEEILRNIATINKNPLPQDARIRPVQIIAVGIGLKVRFEFSLHTFQC